MKKFCDFCKPLVNPVVHRVYKNSDYYFCKDHLHLGPLGILEEFRLDTNQEEVKK